MVVDILMVEEKNQGNNMQFYHYLARVYDGEKMIIF